MPATVRRVPSVSWIAALVLALLVGVLAVPARRAEGIPPTAALTFGGPRLDATTWRSRQDAFLAFATATPMNDGSINSIMAHAERHQRDAGFAFDGSTPQPSDFTSMFEKLATYQDTGDFDINAMLQLWYGYRADVNPDLIAAFEQRIKAFKYWWTEPTPKGIVDSQYYWTENHQIEFLSNEYLAGQAFPTATFSNSGMTGAEHMAHAKPLILKWVGTRARFGFSEWLSNVYFGEDLEGLVNLAEWSDDPQLAKLATDTLDVLFVEIAQHLQDGSFGVTHGRSYMKDKMTARDEDIFNLDKLVFDDTPIAYFSNDVAIAFATARRYVPPLAATNIAKSTKTSVTREHVSLPVPVSPPVTQDPAPAAGQSYDDLMVWWGIGAQFAWPVVPLSVRTINQYDLWKTTNFQDAIGLKPIVDDGTPASLQNLSASLGKQINAGLLSQVDTYTWRSPDVMLSTAQEWRPGQYSEQNHAWQATIDADAEVFTQSPNQALPQTTNWFTNSGYWTGNGATPKSVQHDNVNVSIYAPQYPAATSGPLSRLTYLPFTHAFFPTEKFDEVVELGHWVIGRKGNGYVALWSWRATQWRVYDPATEPTRGLTEPFDLLAPGGADNVWVTEVARAADYSSAPDPFAAFVAAITAATPKVTPLKQAGKPHAYGDGFDVAYASPSQGAVEVGWNSPLTVAGKAIDLHPTARMDSPWAKISQDSAIYRIDGEGAALVLDFTDAVKAATVDTGSSTTTTTAGGEGSTTTAPTSPSTPPATPADPTTGTPTFTG